MPQADQLAMPRDTVTRSAAAEPHISLAGVSKTYGARTQDVVALRHIDLSIRRGEFLSVIGPSGCGKSTLLMMIAGLASPSAGEIRVGGQRVTRPLTDVGIAFQSDLLFDWRTVLGNVLLQADIRRLDRATMTARARQLLKRVGLEGFEQRRPWELSGGMRQRVAMCRALLHGAGLLLMDEPFGALDALTRDQMNLDLQDLWLSEGPTAVLITHSISEAVFLSDRVIVLSPRPGCIALDIEIDLPRPRTIEVRDTMAFLAYQRRLRAAIVAPPGSVT